MASEPSPLWTKLNDHLPGSRKPPQSSLDRFRWAQHRQLIVRLPDNTFALYNRSNDAGTIIDSFESLLAAMPYAYEPFLWRDQTPPEPEPSPFPLDLDDLL